MKTNNKNLKLFMTDVMYSFYSNLFIVPMSDLDNLALNMI